ncbi:MULTISPECIES: sel1 repeat family protein [unclassified Roseitalea]|uniref:tetratricopeptide repeat protein n=1 Tax=unclassified Roseitalea TaxID=2639107 RepID=UPI00273FFB9E|nr:MULTISPECIES: sel1 repeat family protein [unclassified Roseitalea]
MRAAVATLRCAVAALLVMAPALAHAQAGVDVPEPAPSRFGEPASDGAETNGEPAPERFGGLAQPGAPASGAARQEPRPAPPRDGPAAGPSPARFGGANGSGGDNAPEGAADTGNGPSPARFGPPPPDAAYGAFQRGMYLTARNLALPRAQAGDSAAQLLLAEIYSRGLGVAVDEAEATRWYAQAARQGEPEAQFRYALILLRDDEDSPEARTLMKAAAEAGNAMAMFNHAQLSLADRPGPSGQNEAFAYFLEAAEKGIADAQYAVAQYYAQGRPPALGDEAEARTWLRRAAEQGFDAAQFELGGMMLEGIGGDRDLRGGFVWTARAARQGNIAAQAQLAKLYWAGIGTEPNVTEAAGWYVLARRAGLRDRVLEDFWLGLSDAMQRQGIERANRLRGG